MVDTKTVTRREVCYTNLDEVVDDARRLVAAGAKTSGNWSVGQILEHVATVMEKSIDGFQVWPPIPVRLVGRWFLKKRFLREGMPAGFQLKGPIAKELLPPEVDPQQALDHLCRAVARLQEESTRAVHPFFGPLSVAESNQINCRHAQLHFSFINEP